MKQQKMLITPFFLGKQAPCEPAKTHRDSVLVGSVLKDKQMLLKRCHVSGLPVCMEP